MHKFPDFLTAVAAGLAVVVISAIWSKRARAGGFTNVPTGGVFNLATVQTPEAIRAPTGISGTLTSTALYNDPAYWGNGDNGYQP